MSRLCGWGGNYQETMSLIISLLSAVLLGLIIYFFIKTNRNDPWVISALLFKIASGIVLGIVYKYYYEGGDTLQYFKDAGILAGHLIENPSTLPDILFNTLNITDISRHISYADQPRALFFTKIVFVFYLISGGNYWLIGAYLSIISFYCTYIFVGELTIRFRDVRVPAMVSFYFLPSFVFWTSGLLKESLAIGALLILITVCLKMLRLQEFRRISHWMVIIIASAFLWELKYFYAAVALPVLFTLCMYEFISTFKKIPRVAMVLIFAVAIVVASQLHYNLNFSHVAEVVHQNYLMAVERSDGGTIHYFQFDGSISSYIINLPLAVLYGLFRPTAFEAGNVFQLFAGIENSIVIVLSLFAVWGVRKNNIRVHNSYFMGLVVYILCLDVFLAFSTPNFGTLSRYKVAYWPFFVMLVLMALKENPTLKSYLKQKSQALNEPDCANTKLKL
jgi:hypothetical protein